MTYIRDQGMPNVLDFPFQTAASGYAAGSLGATGSAFRLQEDDYARLPDGSDPEPPTFLGNHDMGRAAYQILTQEPGPLPQRKRSSSGSSSATTSCTSRAARRATYGDEVGMIGAGGDQQAREDMFPTQVTDWQTEPRVGSPPIGTGSSFADTENPIERC